jgi:hypothetical protein
MTDIRLVLTPLCSPLYSPRFSQARQQALVVHEALVLPLRLEVYAEGG